MKTALRIASTADGGYVAGQRFHAYYPDFQGNVHVVASDGEFLQSNHYFSINGDNLTSSGSHVGGRKFNDVAVGCWDSPEDFFNSPYNIENDQSKDDHDPSMNNYGYTRVI